MADNLHDVVKLLLKRMESHPEEFGGELTIEGSRTGRWWQVIRMILDCGTEAEIATVNAGIREIKLQRAHELMMDELLNGDERRRKEQEEHEYERQMMAQQAMRISANGSIGIGNVTPSHPLVVKTPARHPTSSDMEKNGIMSAIRNLVK